MFVNLFFYLNVQYLYNNFSQSVKLIADNEWDKIFYNPGNLLIIIAVMCVYKIKFIGLITVLATLWAKKSYINWLTAA